MINSGVRRNSTLPFQTITSHPNFRPSTLSARESLGGTYPGLLLAINRDVDPAIFEFLAGESVVTSVVPSLA